MGQGGVNRKSAQCEASLLVIVTIYLSSEPLQEHKIGKTCGTHAGR